MIEYKNINKSYNGVSIIEDLNLTIKDGEFVVLIGPSGCGKTTTLKMLNRLIDADNGEILINGKNIYSIPSEKLRRNVGYVIQQIGLFPNMTVEQNICVVPKLLKWDKERCSERAKELMEMVHMPYEKYGDKYPNELSGGQQQRIGVLRAMAAEPPIILMDEPFGALDPITRDVLQDEVKQLQKRLGITVIFVTHDMNEAIKMADTIIFMNKGKVLQAAPPEEMLKAPANDIIKEFMGRHVHNYSGQEEKAEEMLCKNLMKTHVITVTDDKKTLECVATMSSREIDSLIIVDASEHFKGIVTIEEIRRHGVAGQVIAPLVKADVPTVREDSQAKEAFDILIIGKAPYVVVLNQENQVVGIITKTSMSKALASAVWGDLT